VANEKGKDYLKGKRNFDFSCYLKRGKETSDFVLFKKESWQMRRERII
jgi:hypothetical protein